MEKPVLVIMAAGMGSRYGGLKQIDPVGNFGEVIMDYSIYDALKAGFEKIVFVIKKDIEADFREVIGDRISKMADTVYTYQCLDTLPKGYTAPEGRTKPWGTAQAVLSVKDVVKGPFAVINADDYYGPGAFADIYKYLSENTDENGVYNYAMVGYSLLNTLTENGHVARGVCKVDGNNILQSVTERTRIEKTATGAHFTEDDGASWEDLPNDSIVSMNLWGFTNGFLQETENRFAEFLDVALKENPLKGEYFLPSVVSSLIAEKKATVKVLTSPDKWYGVTYAKDKPVVMAAIKQKNDDGTYPSPLWKNHQK